MNPENTSQLVATLSGMTNEQLEENLAHFKLQAKDAADQVALHQASVVEAMAEEVQTFAKRIAGTANDKYYKSADKIIQIREYIRVLSNSTDHIARHTTIYTDQLEYYTMAVTVCQAMLVGRGYAASFAE